MTSVGIRKVAVNVNHLLKNLIRTSDDEDTLTDEDDQTHINLAAGGPSGESTPQQATTPPPAGDGRKEEKEDENKESGEVSTDIEILPQQQRSRSQAIDSTQEPIRLYLLPVIGVLLAHTKFTAQETRLETLHWLLWLHKRLPKRVCLFVTLSTCVCLSLCLSVCLSVSLLLSVYLLPVYLSNLLVQLCQYVFYCVYEAILSMTGV